MSSQPQQRTACAHRIASHRIVTQQQQRIRDPTVPDLMSSGQGELLLGEETPLWETNDRYGFQMEMVHFMIDLLQRDLFAICAMVLSRFSDSRRVVWAAQTGMGCKPKAPRDWTPLPSPPLSYPRTLDKEKTIHPKKPRRHCFCFLGSCCEDDGQTMELLSTALQGSSAIFSRLRTLEFCQTVIAIR